MDQVIDDTLGLLVWSADADGWIGEYGGMQFVIAYDYDSYPTSELLAYAKTNLTSPELLTTKIDAEKQDVACDYPELAGEIFALRIGEICFYKRKRTCAIIADLEGGIGDRSWRVEFEENECEGIGFDT